MAQHSTPPTPQTPAPSPTATDYPPHQEGLRLVAEALTDAAPYQRILELDAQRRIDHALAAQALHVAHARSSTTVTLEMSEEDACSILHLLIAHFTEHISFDAMGMNGVPDEDTLSWMGSYAAGITAMADALQGPSMAKRERAAGRPVRPTTATISQLVRGEHVTDPTDRALLIDLAQVWQETPAASTDQAGHTAPSDAEASDQ